MVKIYAQQAVKPDNTFLTNFIRKISPYSDLDTQLEIYCDLDYTNFTVFESTINGIDSHKELISIYSGIAYDKETSTFSIQDLSTDTFLRNANWQFVYKNLPFSIRRGVPLHCQLNTDKNINIFITFYGYLTNTRKCVVDGESASVDEIVFFKFSINNEGKFIDDSFEELNVWYTNGKTFSPNDCITTTYQRISKATKISNADYVFAQCWFDETNVIESYLQAQYDEFHRDLTQ